MPPKIFGVFEDGKPCNHERFPAVHHSWNNYLFDNFQDAKKYAKKWLGEYAILLPPDWDGKELEYMSFDPEVKGSIIEIREVT